MHTDKKDKTDGWWLCRTELEHYRAYTSESGLKSGMLFEGRYAHVSIGCLATAGNEQTNAAKKATYRSRLHRRGVLPSPSLHRLPRSTDFGSGFGLGCGQDPTAERRTVQ